MQTPGIYPMRLDCDKGEYIFTRPGFKRDDLTEAPPLNEENNPYRGLKPFEERHSRFFFGRKALVEALSHRLTQSRRPLTVVLGASGSGKSSLVKAGLLPHLREKQEKDEQAQGWYILDPMRPGKSPFTELARTLLPVANSNLIAQLAQVSFLDKTFAEILDPISEQKQKAASPNPTQPDSREGLSGDDAFDATKLAQCWNHAEPEAKLLLVVDYFAQLQGFCHQPQEQEQLSRLYHAIEQTLNRLTQALQQEPQSFTHLIATWSQVNPSTKLLLVIDQFEELITMSQDDDRGNEEQSDSQEQDEQKEWQRFLFVLRLALAKYRQQLHIVLTLRSDFEPRFLNSALKSHWKNARFPVRAMNSDELRNAIEGPALKQALYFEPPELVGRLIDEVGQMPGALPLLSFTLSELYIKLYERWTKDKSTDRALLLEDYNELGGVAGALTRRATEEYNNLVREFGKEQGKAYQATMRRVMLRMVTIEGGGVARRRVPESELVYADAKEDNRREQVIDRLVKARLLVKGQETEEPYVEPAHDFLVRGWDRLQIWIKKEQENLVVRQRLTIAANDWIRRTGSLWIEEADRLVELNKIITSNNNWLNRLETVFVKRSSKVRQDRIKKLEEDLRISEERRIRAELQGKAIKISNLLISQPLKSLVLAIESIGQNLKELPNQFLGENAVTEAVEVVREQNCLIGHQDHITSVAVSPNGKYIASGSKDKTVCLWDDEGNLLIKPFEGHEDAITSVAFSPDGECIASTSKDGTIRLWDTQGNPIGQPLTRNNASFKVKHQLRKAILCHPSISTSFSLFWAILTVIFKTNYNSINQNLFIFVFALLIISAIFFIYFFPILPKAGIVATVAFSPDNRHIITGHEDGTLRLWNRQDAKIQKLFISNIGTPFMEDNAAVTSVVFSSDGRYIVSGGQDKQIRVWNRAGKLSKRFLGHELGVKSLAFSPDDQLIVSASRDGTVRLWDLQGKPVGQPFRGHESEVTAVAFSPNGKYIISGSYDKTIRLWNYEGVPIGQPIRGHDREVTSVAFSRNGKTIISGSYDKSIRLWDTWGESNEQLPQEIKHGLTTIAFSPDERRIITGSYDGKLQLWNLQGEPIGKPFLGHHDTITSVAFDPSGKLVASSSLDNSLQLWDLQDNTIIQKKLIQRTITGSTKSIPNLRDSFVNAIWFVRQLLSRQLLFSLIVCSFYIYFSKQIYNLSYFIPISILIILIIFIIINQLRVSRYSKQVFNSISFTPDGRYLISGGTQILQFWSLGGQSIGIPYKVHSGLITSIMVANNGKTIVSGSRDGTVRFLELASHVNSFGKRFTSKKNHLSIIAKYYPVYILEGHEGSVTSVAVSENGVIASGSSDRTIRLWTRNTCQFLLGHQDEVTSVAISRDGQTIVSGSRDGTVRLWNGQGKSITQPLEGHGQGLIAVAISRDGQTIASAGNDGIVRLWNKQGDLISQHQQKVSKKSGKNLETCLQIACNRLRNHTVFKNPQTEIEKSACETCQKYVWSSSELKLD